MILVFTLASISIVALSAITGLIQAFASWPQIQKAHKKILYWAFCCCIVLALISGGEALLPNVQPSLPSAHTLVSSRTITEQKILSCAHCLDGVPVTVTIEAITLDAENQQSIWTLTLKNMTNSSLYVYNVAAIGITLRDAHADPVVGTGYSLPQLASGASETTEILFHTGIYQGVAYTFTAYLLTNTSINLPFDPVTITF